MIYLDNNATTPVDPEVSDAVFSSLKRDFGNPSSSHAFGLRAREAVEKGRQRVAELLGCSSEEVVFTSGGTEANNLAIFGVALAHEKGHIITSAIEHPSVINPCRHLEALGCSVSCVPVDREGVVIVDAIADAIRKETVLISVMHANNETGVMQPVEEIAEIARRKGIIFHIDAAQTIGKIPFSISSAPADLLTVVSHKFYGPKGVGALYVRSGVSLKPSFFGAGHERGLRPGTENVAGIVGLGKACQIAVRDIKMRVAHTAHLGEILLKEIRTAIPETVLNGHPTKRLPNTLNIRIPGIRSYEMVETIRESVAVSGGSACHAGIQAPSGVLKGMGLSDDEALSSVRLSVGKDNTEDEIRKAAAVIAEVALSLRKKSGA